MSSISEALLSLRPNAQFYLKGSKLTWLDSKQTEPTKEEIDAEIVRLKKEWENKQYQRDRKVAYPSIEDQLDKIYHSGIDEWKKDIKAVKDKFPKP
jgi:hypothetical protein